MRLQNEALLLDFSVHLPLPDHRSLLRRGVPLHRLPGHVHPHWKLSLVFHGLGGTVLPDHRHLLDDVSEHPV